MEKAVLTKEQAERIEELREKHKSNFMIIRNASFTDTRNKVAFDDPDQLVKALYFGYEKKKQYKKVDWVKLKDRNEAIKLSYDWMVDQANGIHYERIRPATEEEASAEWFKRHGREHCEIKKGDILKRVSTGFIFEVTDPDTVKGHCRVVCFAHERKDI